MNRARASVPPDAIRIEDEVWQEAFRETARPRVRPHLRSLEGGRVAGRTAPRRTAAPRPVGARRTSGPVSTRSAAAPVPRAAGPVSVVEVTDRPMPVSEAPARRTITITGRGAEKNLPWPTESSRRRERRAHERVGFRPDRVAMWAVFLGMLLVLVAALSAHA